MALSVNRAMTGHSLNQEKPIFFWVVKYDIRHFPMRIHRDAKLTQKLFIKIAPFLASIANINQDTTWHITGSEAFDDLFNKVAVFTWADIDLVPIVYFNWDKILNPFFCIFLR